MKLDALSNRRAVHTLALPAVLACWTAASLCAAGTIRHDRLDQAYRDYGNTLQFAPVGRYSAGSLLGSHTLIAPQWAITAAHVVDIDRDGSVDDEDISNDRARWDTPQGTLERRVTQLIVPTGINGNPGWNGDANRGFDIALVRLDSPITTITPASIYTTFQELGKTMTAVGYGAGGNGTTGSTTSYGVKRAGDNIVDQLVNFDNGASGLRWDFDEPSPRVSRNYSGSNTPLDLEYQIASGDSGGGSFIFEDGAWHLAAINSASYDFYNYPTPSPYTNDSHTYGDGALFTRVAAYQQFIFSNIPELASVAIPEPANLTLLALAGLLIRRRARSTPSEASTDE